MKKLLYTIATLSLAISTQARVSMVGQPADYGLKDINESSWYDINPHTWDVFTSFDGDEIFGTKSVRYTAVQVEFHSIGVIEGRKVGAETIVGSFQDRGAFFGGEGYLDLYYFAPVDISKYAQQAVALGGWKYNLTKYVNLDLGGNVIYSTKRVIGPGIAGYGGETLRGDFYAGFVGDIDWISPFVYVDYDATYDALKFFGGFSPKIDLAPYTKIKGLSLETQITFGYVKANRWSGEYKIDGHYWHNDYAYIQADANLVYLFNKTWRSFIGVGWACHNDGKGNVGQGGVDMGPDQMVWFSCGLGYVF